jgi:tRNA dimethylallyltransferase
MACSKKKQVLVIVGPTASGKSDLALNLSQKTHIINGDSQQLYKAFPCLSALPTVEQMNRKPHRLYGILDDNQKCSAAMWAQWVKDEITDAHVNDALPIIVGGTGFYLNILLEGMSLIPDVPEYVQQKGIRLEKEQGLGKLREDLKTFDPTLYATLKPNDRSRILRAWCVFTATRTPLSTFQSEPKKGGIWNDFSVILLAIFPAFRNELYSRIDTRFVNMIKNGAVQEIQAFNRHDHYESLPAFRAIGAAQIDAYLKQKISLEEAISLGQQKSRHYAKRQLTWIRNKLSYATVWNNFGEAKESQEYLESLLFE